MATRPRGKKKKAEPKVPEVFTAAGSNKEVLTFALSEWKFIPFDTLAFHTDTMVTLSNGLECLYVQLNHPVTWQSALAAQEHYRGTGQLGRTSCG